MKNKEKRFNSKFPLKKSKISGKMQYTDFLSVITRWKIMQAMHIVVCVLFYNEKITSLCLSITLLKPTYLTIFITYRIEYVEF